MSAYFPLTASVADVTPFRRGVMSRRLWKAITSVISLGLIGSAVVVGIPLDVTAPLVSPVTVSTSAQGVTAPHRTMAAQPSGGVLHTTAGHAAFGNRVHRHG